MIKMLFSEFELNVFINRYRWKRKYPKNALRTNLTVFTINSKKKITRVRILKRYKSQLNVHLFRVRVKCYKSSKKSSIKTKEQYWINLANLYPIQKNTFFY